MILYIQNIPIKLTLVDGSVEFFTLESPNAGDPFQVRANELKVRDKFRDRNNILRKGLNYYFLSWEYKYDHHNMDLRKLLTAEKIELAAPPDLSGEYESYNVRIVNDQVMKNWLNNMPSAAATYEDFDVVPSGSLTLEFEMTDLLTWEELLDVKWFETTP